MSTGRANLRYPCSILQLGGTVTKDKSFQSYSGRRDSIWAVCLSTPSQPPVQGGLPSGLPVSGHEFRRASLRNATIRNYPYRNRPLHSTAHPSTNCSGTGERRARKKEICGSIPNRLKGISLPSGQTVINGIGCRVVSTPSRNWSKLNNPTFGLSSPLKFLHPQSSPTCG